MEIPDMQLMRTDVQLMTSLKPGSPPWLLMRHVSKTPDGKAHTSPIFALTDEDARTLIANIQRALLRLSEIQGANRTSH